jgi:hypothetical protein
VQPISRTEKAQRTQCAAQFLAGSELVRRYYVVSFTMGNNTPDADLMVGTQGGKTVLGGRERATK